MKICKPNYEFHYKKSTITIQSDNSLGFFISDKRFYLSELDVRIGDTKEKICRELPKSFSYIDYDRIEIRISDTEDFIVFIFEKDKLSQFFLPEPDC